MTRAEVAALFRVTTRTVDAMVADGRLKAHTLGPRLVRFRRSDVEAALTQVNANTPRGPSETRTDTPAGRARRLGASPDD